MATMVPSNTARPVAAPNSNGVSRGSSHRRRQSQQIPPTTGALVEPMPAAPDVPRAPPSSFKDPYAQKSASKTTPRSSRDPPIQVNASRQQPTIQSAAGRLYELRSPPYAPVEPLSGTVERRSSQRKPSVPDRSPLQKLEGKLDDISKEERRARILEAELAAQERVEADMRARRAREAAEKERRLAAQPIPTYEPIPNSTDRTSSNKRHVSQPTYEMIPNTTTHRTDSNKRHVSAPLQSHPKSPDISDLESEDGYVYDLSEPWDPSAAQAVAVPAPHRVPSQRQPRLTSISKVPQGDPSITRNASIKGKEPAGVSRGLGSFRERTIPPATSATSAAPAVQQIRRKPIEHPIGSLTPLSGLGLEDAGIDDTMGGAEVLRSDSRKLTKDSHWTQQPARHGSQRDSRGIMAARMEMQQQQQQHKGLPQNNGQFQVHPYDSPLPAAARKSVGFSDIDSEIHPQAMHDSHRFLRHRGPDRTYIRPPMLEEWRQAPIATLVAEDLDLAVPARTPSTTNNKTWWEDNQAGRRRRSGTHAESTYDGYADEPTSQTSFSPPLYLKCGPLLRYTGLRKDQSRAGKDREIWRGSVMIVTTDADSSYQRPPTLRLFKQAMDIVPPPTPEEREGDELNPAHIDPIEGQFKVSRSGQTMYVKPVDDIAENEDLSRVEDGAGLFSFVRSTNGAGKPSRIYKKDGEKLGKVREISGVRLHAERGVTFWRFNLEVELGSTQARVAYRINNGPAVGFWVPAKGETMNIMFHSCNGFSLSVDSKEFCGPDPMWRDVLNSHQSRPFHVMLGGGDQIYNDAAMKQTTLFRQWTENRNPMDKHHTPFSEEMQNELEQFYLDRYSMWFSQGLFGMANSQIPMVNIWDDHDIIDVS